MQERRKDSNDQTFQLFCEKFDDHNKQITALFNKIDNIVDNCAHRGEDITSVKKDIDDLKNKIHDHAVVLVGEDGQSGLNGMMKSIVTSFKVMKVLFVGFIMSLPVIAFAQKLIAHFSK